MNLSRPLLFNDDKKLNELSWEHWEKELFNPESWHPRFKMSLDKKIDNVAENILNYEFWGLLGHPCGKDIIIKPVARYLESLCIKKRLITKNNSRYNKIVSEKDLYNYVKKKKLELIQSKNKKEIYFMQGKKKRLLTEIEQSTDGIWESEFKGEWKTFIRFSDFLKDSKHI